MGGIEIDKNGATSMKRLYAAGETACNGVHGKNRLASNSLLESLVFAGRAASDITDSYCEAPSFKVTVSEKDYENYAEIYKNAVLNAIEKEKKSHE